MITHSITLQGWYAVNKKQSPTLPGRLLFSLSHQTVNRSFQHIGSQFNKSTSFFGRRSHRPPRWWCRCSSSFPVKQWRLRRYERVLHVGRQFSMVIVLSRASTRDQNVRSIVSHSPRKWKVKWAKPRYPRHIGYFRSAANPIINVFILGHVRVAISAWWFNRFWKKYSFGNWFKSLISSCVTY